MPKHNEAVMPSLDVKEPLGIAPGVLAKRDIVKTSTWCPNPKPDIEFDQWCDPLNPKTIIYKDVLKAASAIKEEYPYTPLVKSRYCKQFGLDLHYKFEIFHRTGSFNERGALYSLMMLSDEQKKNGVITASLGNWAMALAYQGYKLNIPIMVVLPVHTLLSTVEKCEDFGATVVLNGVNLAESKRHAFVMAEQNSRTYINGYDHPHVIAASGTIGLEILEQLPQTDAILVPVGGGGLIAGIAAVVKHLNPQILIYGIEPDKCCSFFKAMENEEPYQTAIGRSVAETLGVPTAGCNAFHTAKSLIDKMVLVDDDWIARAILHLVENEKMVAEGAGATSLSALLAVPDVLPELKGKSIVCVITGGNIDQIILPRCLERAKAVEGRLIKLTVTLPADSMNLQLKVLSMIANVGCNVLWCDVEHAWLLENDFRTIYFNLIIETFSLEHSCTLKRVMERLFPNICDFLEEPFSPIPICACFPKRFP
ncbi:L-threonine ammonia-lyase-like [Ostrinia nubilalis]|uniref:L-threonine ammonia-lyase-like n=1 Tax=Ostrinia nubilalis TaxID=29057 RepID=UPI0030825BF1